MGGMFTFGFSLKDADLVLQGIAFTMKAVILGHDRPKLLYHVCPLLCHILQALQSVTIY